MKLLRANCKHENYKVFLKIFSSCFPAHNDLY